jgi:hypothetical protein
VLGTVAQAHMASKSGLGYGHHDHRHWVGVIEQTGIWSVLGTALQIPSAAGTVRLNTKVPAPTMAILVMVAGPRCRHLPMGR